MKPRGCAAKEWERRRLRLASIRGASGLEDCGSEARPLTRCIAHAKSSFFQTLRPHCAPSTAALPLPFSCWASRRQLDDLLFQPKIALLQLCRAPNKSELMLCLASGVILTRIAGHHCNLVFHWPAGGCDNSEYRVGPSASAQC